MFGFISSEYNYSHFTRDKMARDLNSRAFDHAPEPGERALDFTARTLTPRPADRTSSSSMVGLSSWKM